MSIFSLANDCGLTPPPLTSTCCCFSTSCSFILATRSTASATELVGAGAVTVISFETGSASGSVSFAVASRSSDTSIVPSGMFGFRRGFSARALFCHIRPRPAADIDSVRETPSTLR
uniref:(northern house mosquito) hypothetical protein n=1 Tax=Culex pipiens TaxID=7175 RepID=A0A8D8AEJ5_CULPI